MIVNRLLVRLAHVGLALAALAAAPGLAAAQSANDILVFGERMERPLADTTSSVDVLSSADVESRNLKRLADVVERTANLAPVYGSGGFSIRGISNIGVSNAGEAPTANVYIDDIPLAPTFLHGAPSEMWDIRQVELWRGPQTTLRGPHALAGAIIIETADPSLERWEGFGRVSMSDESEHQLGIALGGPIRDHDLALRASMSLTRRDGFIRNMTRGGREDQESRDLMRAKLLWQPKELSSLSIAIGYSHFRRRGGAFATYARTDEPGYPGARIATDNTPNRTDVDFDGVTGRIRYALSPNLAVVSSTTWSRVREASTFDGDYGPGNLAYGDQVRLYRTLTQELRVNLDSRKLTGVAGVYYFDRGLASRTFSRTTVATPAETIAGLLRSGGFPPAAAAGLAEAYRAALPAIPVDFSGSFPTEMRTAAAFADLRWHLDDRLSILAGLRIDRYDAENGTEQSARFAGTYPNPASFGSLAPVIAQINTAVGGFVAQANGSSLGIKSGETSFLPKAGILMAWTPHLSTSFVAQRAYRPGGVSVNIARGLAFPYASEFAWNYEFALRSSLAGGRLHLDFNLYQMRWRNQQVTVNFGLNSFDTNTVNAGASRLRGFEASARWQLRPGWSLRGSLGHASTRFDRFVVPQLGVISDLSQAQFAFAPRWTLVGGTDFELANGIAGSLNVSHSTRAFGAVGSNQAAYPVDARTIVDVRLGYDNGRWSGFVSARNLLNDVAVMYRSPTENRAVLNAPRSVAIEVAAKF